VDPGVAARDRHGAASEYQRVLAGRSIICGTSRRGNCHINAVVESVFSTVKNELGERFDGSGDAKMQLFDRLKVFYNQRRRTTRLGRMRPAALERMVTQAA
jgi:putative transposase